MINKKEFGDWAVTFWKKGSKVLHIAQNQGEPNTTNYWMVGTTTRQFDYESGWLPNKEWTSTIKGHFSKEKAVQIAKENAMKENKGLKESELKERVLDYDTYDEFYKKGCEAYFEGKSLDEVPVTGNAWFREAWQEGWKDSKAADDEDVRRAEAEYEDELEWEDYYSSLSESESKLTESRVKLTKNHDNIVEALRAAIASFQSIGVQVQLIDEMFGQKTLDVSYGPYHVFFDTLDDEDGLYDGYGKYLLTLPLASESDVQWIGGNENELFADLKDVVNVLDKIMAEPNKNDRNFAD